MDRSGGTEMKGVRYLSWSIFVAFAASYTASGCEMVDDSLGVDEIDEDALIEESDFIGKEQALQSSGDERGFLSQEISRFDFPVNYLFCGFEGRDPCRDGSCAAGLRIRGDGACGHCGSVGLQPCMVGCDSGLGLLPDRTCGKCGENGQQACMLMECWGLPAIFGAGCNDPSYAPDAADGICKHCGQPGEPVCCDMNCAPNAVLVSDRRCVAVPCRPFAWSCSDDQPCCTGLECRAGKCSKPCYNVGGSCTVPGAKGVCAQGTLECSIKGSQCKTSTSTSPEVCDGKDNDCNGTVDDIVATKCETEPSECQSGFKATGISACQYGKQICKTTPNSDYCTICGGDCGNCANQPCVDGINCTPNYACTFDGLTGKNYCKQNAACINSKLPKCWLPSEDLGKCK